MLIANAEKNLLDDFETLKCIAKPKLQNPSSSRFNALEGKSYCGFPLGFQRQKRKYIIAMMFHFFPMICLYCTTCWNFFFGEISQSCCVYNKRLIIIIIIIINKINFFIKKTTL